MRTNTMNQRGFTILELIIASTVFSTIMLLATTGLIQIGRTYHKGQITAKTQEVTRSIVEEVSRAVQFSNQDVSPAPDGNVNGVSVKAVCIGDTRYTYVDPGLYSKFKLGQSDVLTGEFPTLAHLVWQDKKPAGACATANFTETGGRELLAQNMRLNNFQITQTGDNVEIKIKVYYGDWDLTEPDINGFCESSKTGGQFCAQSDLSTVVRRRI